MSYSTPAEIKQLAMPRNAYTDLDDAIIQSALDAASADVDDALRVNHALPLANVPVSVVEAVRILTAWRLQLYVGSRVGDGDVDTAMYQRYQEIAGVPGVPGSGWLYQVSSGKITFDLNVSPTRTDYSMPISMSGADCSRRWAHGVR